MKKKNMLIVIIILVIGFASVSTNLIINGVLGIATNQDDFNIIFTSAKLDNVDRNDFIDSTKKKITFETNKLKTIDDESILDYEVTNTSRIYDGEVSISCIVPDNEFVLVDYEPKSMIVEAGKTKSGNIKAKLIKSSVEDSNISITCTLSAKATERDTLGDEYVDPNKVGGTLMEGRLRSNSDYVTKIIFENRLNPHETTEDLTYDVSEAQDKSVMAYAVENSESTNSVKRYDLYIQSKGKIMANENSSKLFYSYSNLKSIEGLEYFDTSNVINMYKMFCLCKSLTTLDLSNFDTSNVTNMQEMFAGEFFGSDYIYMNFTTLDLSSFDTSNVTNMYGMFRACNRLTTLNVSNFDTSNVTNMYDMFFNCIRLTTLDVSKFNTSKVTTMHGMFNGCESLKRIDVSNFNTSNVIDMRSMFSRCNSLTTLNVSSFDTSNITSTLDMFWECRSLTTLDVTNFNTSKVTNMSGMFRDCSSLTMLDVSNFDTSNVTGMSSMFSGCSRLTSLDLSNFDTSKLISTTYMFQYCYGLTSLDLSNFDTRNVNSMRYMFDNCSHLTTLDISNFNTSKVTDMMYMFENCSSLTSLDLSNFDTSIVMYMQKMFYGCSNLIATINIYNPSVSNYSNMFSGAATNNGANFTVNYIESTSSLVDQMVATKSSSSNVVKGNVMTEYSITITGNDDIISSVNKAASNKLVTLLSASGDYYIKSFKLNGTVFKGKKFIMPNTDVTITDIVVEKCTIIESEHNPYPNSLNNKVYGEMTFEGATSLTVTLDYQTDSSFYDYIYLYDSTGKSYGKYYGVTRKKEIITIPGNYIKVVFRTNYKGNDYYGFKASIALNYD